MVVLDPQNSLGDTIFSYIRHATLSILICDLAFKKMATWDRAISDQNSYFSKVQVPSCIFDMQHGLK